MVTRGLSPQAFFEELSLSTHLSVPAVLIPLRGRNCLNLARCINHFLLQGSSHLVSCEAHVTGTLGIPSLW